MKKIQRILSLILLLAVLVSCTGKTETQIVPEATEPQVLAEATDASQETSEEIEEVEGPPLYVNLTWHQHQPLYYKNADGVYSRPWVRVHATKDYLDMVEVIDQHPGMKATINITPSLIVQLEDFVKNGTKDLYWTLAEVPAAELTTEQKTFILERFFDANWDHIIAVHPRYKELLDQRGGTDAETIAAAVESFSEQDFRDLQIWFNLAWVDPDYLAEEPFKALVDKGRDFSEEDKVTLFDGIFAIIEQVIPTHKALQDKGVIEVTTTPYAHPILPLIYNSDLALVGNPKAITPREPFTYPQDANYHLLKSVEMYEEHFGMPVRGLWPGEGSVAQEIVPMVSKAGYQWMQTGEPVLVASLGMDGDRFNRDSNEVPIDGDALYRPYYVQGSSGEKVAVFFRDWNISDKVGFTYSGMSGEAAANDMVNHLKRIRASLKDQEGPHIVTIVVDGENAWENYDNDGKEFFHTLYDLLANDENLITITPSEYLELFPEQRELKKLFPGAWFSTNYDTWYGEEEEAEAWNLLGRVRLDLAKAESGEIDAPNADFDKAYDFMYLAEGSDWFWWYGTDQDSGQDSYFDEGYRELLKNVYISLGLEPPAFLDIPVIQPQMLKPDVAIANEVLPEIDGEMDDDEWEGAGIFGGSDPQGFESFLFALDQETLSFGIQLLEALTEGESIELYINVPNDQYRMIYDESGEIRLTSPATRMLKIRQENPNVELYITDGESWHLKESEIGKAVATTNFVEIGVPVAVLESVSNGTNIPLNGLIRRGEVQLITPTQPFAIQYLSFEPLATIFYMEDPKGDDYGPGSYTYPKDGVFKPGDFDLLSFEIASDGTDLVFSFVMDAPITNGWGSPAGFSVQTFDVYIDKDPGAGTGSRLLLPGRNAALGAEDGWEMALWVEGWTPQVLGLDADNKPVNLTEASSAMKIFVDSGKNAVVVSVPLEYFGDGEPGDWGYAVAVLGQEGFPAEGVWRVRDVNQKAESYRFGGAPADNNHTRIIDLLMPVDGSTTQEAVLSNYPSSAAAADPTNPDGFAIIPLLLPK